MGTVIIRPSISRTYIHEASNDTDSAVTRFVALGVLDVLIPSPHYVCVALADDLLNEPDLPGSVAIRVFKSDRKELELCFLIGSEHVYVWRLVPLIAVEPEHIPSGPEHLRHGGTYLLVYDVIVPPYSVVGNRVVMLWPTSIVVGRGHFD